MKADERLTARLHEIIAPEVKAMGFDLVRIMVFGRTEVGDEETTLQVMAERPETGQLVLDDCAALSHRISDAMDAAEAAGETLLTEAYRLEVSSPGIDRPLTRLADFAQWAGHEAKIALTAPIDGNRKALQGVLAGVEDGVILFDERKSGRVSFTMAEIHSAKLVLTKQLLAATRPIDMAGADEEEVVEDDDETTDLTPTPTEAQED